MPHLADGYVDYLVTHEICHQWWYNVVGTNGYAETWMDEGLATYFSHRLLNQKHGKNNDLLDYPARPGLAAEHPPRGLPQLRPATAPSAAASSAHRAGDAQVRPPRQPVQP